MKCPRCHKSTNSYSMSRFNTEEICLECIHAETKHSNYQAAYDAELAAVKSGNMNFTGIGCPPDLYEPWNISLSYGRESDLEATKLGYKFLGAGRDDQNKEVNVFLIKELAV